MTRIPCVGAVVVDHRRRLLLVLRANPPAQGKWSLPGGRVESGESAEAATLRELAEETGLEGEILRHVGDIEIAAPGGGVYVVRDYAVRVLDLQARAGDDARDVRWFGFEELADLDTSPGLVEALARWGITG